jgi:multidrug efflux pump subunit AcrA (membrane-fusion protein)
MSVEFKPVALLRGALLVGLAVLAVGVYSLRTDVDLPGQISLAMDTSARTALPARVEPGSKSDVVSEFPSRVAAVLTHVGAVVQAGDTLVVLENREISNQIEVARKRLAAAAAHLDALRSPSAAALSDNLSRERMRSAMRNRDSARQRLQAFQLRDSESALKTAQERLEAIRPLVRRGLATEAELDEYERRLDSAAREAEAAREHLSHLSQELDQAESQVRLLELQDAGSAHDPASAEADYADAQAALMAAEERGSRLEVKATSGGTVLSLPVRQDEWILPGTRIAHIADLSTLKISAPVTAALARAIQVGRPLSVLLPGAASERIPTTVKDVLLVPDATHQAYLVQAVVANPDPTTVLVGLDAQLEFDHLDAR